MSKSEDKAAKKALEKFPILFGERMGYDKTNLQQERRNAFEKGYRQAEKDLSDISWIKEVSGVKEMSRAKEEALKAYPPQSIAANYDTIDRRDAFEYGYLEAEKDLEMTWEDIKLLDKIFMNEKIMSGLILGEKEYEEVLKRFKEEKEKIDN